MWESIKRRGISFLGQVSGSVLKAAEYMSGVELEDDSPEDTWFKVVSTDVDIEVYDYTRTEAEVCYDSPAAEAEAEALPVESQEECRICRDGSNAAADPLLSPCNCTGSVQYVHKSCLDSWRAVPRPCGRARDTCEVCHATYKVPSAKELQEQHTTALERFVDAVEAFILAAMPDPVKNLYFIWLVATLLTSAYICRLLKTACVKIRERFHRLLAFVARCVPGRQ